MNAQQHPLRLAVGSHTAGSGKGCLMNVISWQNGDTTITDMPDCVDPYLAKIGQRLNDRICTHRGEDLLCPQCSQIVLDWGHKVVGTAGVAGPVVHVRLAILSASDVRHLNTDPRVGAAIDAAQAWVDDPTYAADANAADADANAAYAAYAAAAADANAAYAANAAAYDANAAYAAYAAAAAAYDANAAAAANAAAYAAYAAAYAAYAAGPLQVADLAFERWCELTGWSPAAASVLDLDGAWQALVSS